MHPPPPPPCNAVQPERDVYFKATAMHCPQNCQFKKSQPGSVSAIKCNRRVDVL